MLFMNVAKIIFILFRDTLLISSCTITYALLYDLYRFFFFFFSSFSFLRSDSLLRHMLQSPQLPLLPFSRYPLSFLSPAFCPRMFLFPLSPLLQLPSLRHPHSFSSSSSINSLFRYLLQRHTSQSAASKIIE